MSTIDYHGFSLNEVCSSAHPGRNMRFSSATGKHALGSINCGKVDNAVAATHAAFADASIWLSWRPVDGVEQYKTVERCTRVSVGNARGWRSNE